MKLDTDDYNNLCKNITVKMAGDFDIFRKLGFDTVGDLVKWMEKYKK